MAKRTVQVVRIGKHELELSNLDKVWYPATGFTKAQAIDYYARVAPVLLPHLKGRALTLKRYPDGVEAPYFYQKTAPPHPDWVDTADIWSAGRDEDIHYVVANKLETLVWLVNAGDLEMHSFMAKAKTPLKPTMVAFDLDPGEGADILDCARVAQWLQTDLAGLGLDCYPKVSGSKGIQVYMPLNTPTTFDHTKTFARTIAEHLQRLHPQHVVSNMRKELRKNKVLVDWSQNDDHKTTSCVYSLRAKSEPSVSAPVTWAELATALKKEDAARLRFGPEETLKRVAKMGDLFAPVLTQKQKLPKGAKNA